MFDEKNDRYSSFSENSFQCIGKEHDVSKIMFSLSQTQNMIQCIENNAPQMQCEKTDLESFQHKLHQ